MDGPDHDGPVVLPHHALDLVDLPALAFERAEIGHGVAAPVDDGRSLEAAVDHLLERLDEIVEDLVGVEALALAAPLLDLLDERLDLLAVDAEVVLGPHRGVRLAHGPVGIEGHLPRIALRVPLGPELGDALERLVPGQDLAVDLDVRGVPHPHTLPPLAALCNLWLRIRPGRVDSGPVAGLFHTPKTGKTPPPEDKSEALRRRALSESRRPGASLLARQGSGLGSASIRAPSLVVGKPGGV